jgi:hypothetical protein
MMPSAWLWNGTNYAQYIYISITNQVTPTNAEGGTFAHRARNLAQIGSVGVTMNVIQPPECKRCNAPPSAPNRLTLNAASYGSPSFITAPIGNEYIQADGAMVISGATNWTKHDPSGWWTHTSLGGAGFVRLIGVDNASFSAHQSNRGVQIHAVNGNPRSAHIDLAVPIARNSGIYGMTFNYNSINGPGNHTVMWFSDAFNTSATSQGTDSIRPMFGAATPANGDGHLRITGSGRAVGAMTAVGATPTYANVGTAPVNTWHTVYAIIDTMANKVSWYVGPIGATSFEAVASGTVATVDGLLHWGSGGLIRSLAFYSGSGGQSHFILGDLRVFEHEVDFPCICNETIAATPTGLGIDYINEQITGLVPNAYYAIAGTNVTANAQGRVTIQAGWFGGVRAVVRRNLLDPFFNSVGAPLNIPARNTAGLSGVGTTPTSEGRFNGSITNLNPATMQYRPAGATNWLAVPSATMLNLRAGTYQIRVAPTSGSFASLAQNVSVAGSACSACSMSWRASDGSAIGNTAAPAFPNTSWAFNGPAVNANRNDRTADIFAFSLSGIGATGLPFDTGASVVFNLVGANPDGSIRTDGLMRNDERRVWYWTDLSNPDLTPSNFSTYFATVPDAAAAGTFTPTPAAHSGMVLTGTIDRNANRLELAIDGGWLYNEGTDTWATTLFIMGYNNSSTVGPYRPASSGTQSPVASNNRFQRDIVTGITSAVLAPIATSTCYTCGACRDEKHKCPETGSCASSCAYPALHNACNCNPWVNKFPLPLNKPVGQNHGPTRQGWNIEANGMQLDSPNGGLTTHSEMQTAGLRYLVLDFKTAPAPFGIVMQGAQVDGVPSGRPYRTITGNPLDIIFNPAAHQLHNQSAASQGTSTATLPGWFGGYVTPSTVTADGVPAKVSDTQYVFDFGALQGGGHFPAKWSRHPDTVPPTDPNGGRYFWHPGFSRAGLYQSFQLLFETGSVSFAAFMNNIEAAYFTNEHPDSVPGIQETTVATRPSVPSPPVLTFDNTGNDLKLYYNYTSSGLSAVRIQYSIDGGATWVNIHRDFSIIDTSTAALRNGSRMELLPAETYNQPNLRIRWIPHGRWGAGWGNGSFSLQNVRLVTGLQLGERARPNSPVRSIEHAVPPSTVPQRGSVTVLAPAVNLCSDAPDGTSTAVTWTSSNLDVARVQGGVIRALSRGTATITVASVADPSVFTTFNVTVGAPVVPYNAKANFNIDNPYGDVIWSGEGAWGQYKAAHHTHSWGSDGNHSTAQMAQRHYELGFHILAITDHDRLNPANAWQNTNTGGNPMNRTNVPPTQAQVEAMADGLAVVVDTGQPADGRMGAVPSRGGAPNSGMIFIPYTNEHSGLRFEAMRHFTTGGHHVNSYWANVDPGDGAFSSSGTTNPDGIKNALERVNNIAGAVSRINHPGRYTGSQYPTAWADAARIANDPAIFTPYAELFLNNPGTVGMEIINKFDTESQAERILWDNILSLTMSDTAKSRPVWGFSDDDSHSTNAVGFSYNLMLMPELTQGAVRTSMINGSFLAFSRTDRQYGIRPGGIEVWDWDGGRGNRENVLSLPVPVVRDITVSGNSIDIHATMSNSNTAISTGSSSRIHWYADGVMIHTGRTLNLRTHQLSIYSYVRAAVITQNGVIYTQPFGVSSALDCAAVCDCADCVSGSGGGGGGFGGGGGTTTGTAPPEPPNTVHVVDPDADEIDEIVDDINKALEEEQKGIEEALETGSGETITINIVIDISCVGNLDDIITEVVFEVPEAIIEAIIEAVAAIQEAIDEGANVDFSIALPFGLATLQLDLDALVAVFGEDEEVVFNIIHVSEDASQDLDEDLTELVGDRPVYKFVITVGGVPVTDFGGGSITVTIPYELGEDEDQNEIVVQYLGEDGPVTMRGMYIGDSVVFVTNHFSMFVISNIVTVFTDIGALTGAGLADVRFTAARGIFVGKAPDGFDPFARITQAEFLAVLSRLANAGIKDSATGSWFDTYVRWADGFGIVSAADVTPDAALERADMALWLYNLINAAGLRLAPVNTAAPGFTDIGGLGGEYADAIEALYKWGIIEGVRPGVEFGDRISERFHVSHIIARVLRNLFI